MNQRVVEEDGAVVVDRPRRGGLLRAIIGIAVVVVVAAVIAVLVINRTSSSSAKEDVTITTCRGASNGKPKASGRILNHSSKTSNYVIRLKFTDPQGNTVSEGVAPVQSVDSKKTAVWEITGDRDIKGSAHCEITGVSRTHLPGQ